MVALDGIQLTYIRALLGIIGDDTPKKYPMGKIVTFALIVLPLQKNLLPLVFWEPCYP